MSKTINLDEKLECKGYWWLPNNPNETVAGVLTYIPDEKILLELIGAFDSKKDFIDTLLNVFITIEQPKLIRNIRV